MLVRIQGSRREAAGAAELAGARLAAAAGTRLERAQGYRARGGRGEGGIDAGAQGGLDGVDGELEDGRTVPDLADATQEAAQAMLDYQRALADGDYLSIALDDPRVDAKNEKGGGFYTRPPQFFI